MALNEWLGDDSYAFLKTEQLFDFCRTNSLWYLAYGIACCSIEGLMNGSGPRFDFDRMGVFYRNSPRQCDVLIVTGTVNEKMAVTLRRLYDQMPEPRYVVAMGSCACSGGMFRSYPNVRTDVDSIVPVDIYVPGCPPRPESLHYGFRLLQKKIRSDAKKRLEQRGETIASE